MQILYILKSTPFYVYLLFSYLIFIGIKSTKPRIISSPIKLFIMPLIFSLFSLKEVTNIEDFLLFILIMAISFCVNWKLPKPIISQTKNNIMIIPGSYHSLMMIIGIFSVKYYFGYMKTVMPELLYKYKILDLAISALILGVAFSKSYFYYRYFINRIR